MNIFRKHFFVILPLLLAFFSCHAKIDGVVKDGGAADLKLKAALGNRTTALIRSLRFFMGEGAEKPILDGPAIARSMALAPGIQSVELQNADSQNLEGTIIISNLSNFLALSAGKGRFITFTEGRDASSLVITLERDYAPEIISLLSPEVEEYLSALMAPVVLGEAMTRQEYLALVASIYGPPLSGEIAASRIKASIEFPRLIRSIRGGRASGKLAEFDVPLLDILVLENPLSYEVSW